jgi:phosphate-selective porin
MGPRMRKGRRLFATAVAALAMTGRVAAADEPSPAPAGGGGASLGFVQAPRPEAAPSVPLGPHDPLAGVAGERPFLRTPGNEIVLFPGFLLQVGGSFFPQQQDNLHSGFSVRRARLEMSGWLGSMFYFDVAGDFASSADPTSATSHPPTDAYLAFAPLDDLLIVQAGQFDAPFSLENRTRDAYIPFIARSLAVRSLAVPYNKDLGVMVHGTDETRFIYYSGGVFNGDGPNVQNADNRVDFIGRVSVSPLARTSFDFLHEASVGASVWYGQHVAGRAFPTQTTPGGFVFFDPSWTLGRTAPIALDLHESGPTLTLGGELNLPIGRQFGVRGEGILKQQDLSEDSVAADGTTLSTMGRAKLNAIGAYGEAWLWLLGDDRQLPRPGFELPTRLGRVVEPPPEHGVMLAVRGELLQENLTSNQTLLADPNLATTRLASASLAVNYWYGRRVRASLDYILTVFSGTTENIKDTIATSGKTEQEVLLLLAMGL